MMNRKLIIEYTPDLIRGALFEDEKLCEIHVERVKHKRKTESLYLGRVTAIRPSVGAAFVDIGLELHAFLPITEGSKIKCGDFVIVQGTAVQSVDTKGLRISDKPNLAGKWLVLVPGNQGVHVSKKIKDPELRRALSIAIEPLCPSDCGVIVRTASSDVSADALADEIDELENLWRGIQQKVQGMTRPGILHEPFDLEHQLLRDIGGTLSGIVVNDDQAKERIEYLRDKGWIPASAAVQRFDESSQLLGDVYALDAQVDKALRKRVWLDCGGYLVFDHCEALTVVDVNSGKMVLGRDTEDTALRVNLEAAREIARQLRLRDVGGVIVVDYIDMKSEQHREQLLQVIREEAKRDRTQVNVAGITKLGLVEMTRKRKGEQLHRVLQISCKVCDGSGRFLSAEETAFRALRQLRRLIASGQRGPFLIRCASQVAATLSEMTAPDQSHEVYVISESGKHFERFEISQLVNMMPLPKGAVKI